MPPAPNAAWALLLHALFNAATLGGLAVLAVSLGARSRSGDFAAQFTWLRRSTLFFAVVLVALGATAVLRTDDVPPTQPEPPRVQAVHDVPATEPIDAPEIPWESGGSCPGGRTDEHTQGGHVRSATCHVGPLTFEEYSTYEVPRWTAGVFVCGDVSPGVPSEYSQEFSYRAIPGTGVFEYRCTAGRGSSQPRAIIAYRRVRAQPSVATELESESARADWRHFLAARHVLRALALACLLVALASVLARTRPSRRELWQPWRPARAHDGVATLDDGTTVPVPDAWDGDCIVCREAGTARGPYRADTVVTAARVGTLADLRRAVERSLVPRLWIAIIACVAGCAALAPLASYDVLRALAMQ